MLTNSRSKGQRGERQVCHELNELGYPDWQRSQQYQGATAEGAGDIIPDPEGAAPASEELATALRFEVKRYADLPALWTEKMQSWIEQAEAETPAGKRAVLIGRGDREPWRIYYRGASGEPAMTLLTADALHDLAIGPTPERCECEETGVLAQLRSILDTDF